MRAHAGNKTTPMLPETVRASNTVTTQRGAFAGELLRLAEVFDRPVTESLAEIYAEALGDYAIEELHAAVSIAIRTCRFFPRPVELIEMMRDARLQARRALAAAAGARALPPVEVSEEERLSMLERIRAFTAGLVGGMRVRRAPRRSLGEINAEVAMMQAVDRADPVKKTRLAMELERMRAAGELPPAAERMGA